jgi:hypothetical protein
MARPPAIAPRVVGVALPALLMVFGVAAPLVILAVARDGRLILPFAVQALLTVAVMGAWTWTTWCLEHPATRAMGARYRELRRWLDIARDREPVAAGGATITAGEDYLPEFGGTVEMFVRFSSTPPADVVALRRRTTETHVGEVFVLHAHRHVVHRRVLPVRVDFGPIRVQWPSSPSRDLTLWEWTAHLRRRTREARAGVGVATVAELDELLAQLRAGLSWPRLDNVTQLRRGTSS